LLFGGITSQNTQAFSKKNSRDDSKEDGKEKAVGSSGEGLGLGDAKEVSGRNLSYLTVSHDGRLNTPIAYFVCNPDKGYNEGLFISPEDFDENKTYWDYLIEGKGVQNF
jgi:hypothetical protein